MNKLIRLTFPLLMGGLLMVGLHLNAQTTNYLIAGFPRVTLNGSAMPDTTNGPLPLRLIFDNSFNGQTIAIYSGPAAIASKLLVKDLVSRTSTVFHVYSTSHNSYYVEFNKDSSVAPNKKLSDNTFCITVNNQLFGPFNFRAPYNSTYPLGNFYSDVLKLKELANTTNDSLKQEIVKILNSYQITTLQKLNCDSFLIPFFSNVFDSVVPRKPLATGKAEPGIAAATSASPSTASGVSITTTVADALAKFLIKRFKQELSQAFFEHFKEDMNNPNYADLKVLFPETWKTLQTIDNGIFQYSLYLNTLRQSFLKDLTNGFSNLQSLLNQQKYKDYFYNQRPALGSILYTSLYIVNSINAKKHPGAILENFNADNTIKLCNNCQPRTEVTCAQTNIRSGIKAIQLLSWSFRSKSDSNYWVSADSIKSLLEDPTGLKIYLGLLGQVAYNRSIGFRADTSDISSTNLRVYINKLANSHDIDSLLTYKYFIETLVENTDVIESEIATIRTTKAADINYNDYYKLFSSTLNLLDSTRGIFNLPYIPVSQQQKDSINRYADALLYVARSGADLYVDVHSKNYSSAIQNVISILDTLLDLNSGFSQNKEKSKVTLSQNSLLSVMKLKHVDAEDSAKIWNLMDSLVNEPNKPLNAINYTAVNLSDLDSTVKAGIEQLIAEGRMYNQLSQRKNLRQYILKYGSFIAALAQAQNSDDAEAAIESVALPPGSYTIKQKSDFNISVNGYVGYAFDFNSGLSSGIYAPIGVSFNWGLGPKKKGGAFTAFVGILDIGGIVAYRSQDDTTAKLKQDVRLESILSPSVQVMYEIPSWPIAVCAGWRLTPKLVYSAQGTDFYIRQPANVLNLSILVDIPIFTLINLAK